MHIKKGDTVMVNTGSDKGVKGEVLSAIPAKNRVVVKGVNVRKKHMKPKKQGEAGGIIETEIAISASNVNVYCDKCKTGVRIKYKENAKGEKIRVCAKCGNEIK